MIEEDSEIPGFIREFSKEHSSEDRAQKAADIKSQRANFFTRRNEGSRTKTEFEDRLWENERVLAEQLKALEALRQELEEISGTWQGKVAHYLEIRKLKADVAAGEKSYQELLSGQAELKTTTDKATEDFERAFPSGETPEEFVSARAALKDFYEGEKIKWAASEHTKDEMNKYFSEEYLSSLSLEDYALLLQHFPGQMVTHVTRQGIRDHLGHNTHTLGKGAHSDGFMRILEAGRLKSPLAIALGEDEKKQAIAKFLLLDHEESRESALRDLHIMLSTSKYGGQGNAGSFADRSAVHFATEYVADAYYGSETGNEIFFIFPSAHIASQHFFQGVLSEAGEDKMRNDQWVWDSEQKGISLNAGIVFIPAETLVDRKTGSQYVLDDEKRPMVNTEYQEAVLRFAESPDFLDFVERIRKALPVNRGFRDAEEKERALGSLRPIFASHGITDPALQNFLLEYGNLMTIGLSRQAKDKNLKDYKYRTLESAVSESLFTARILFGHSKDVAPAREFWEHYFADHPDRKPSKIVYYQGQDPMAAVEEWRLSNGINPKAADWDFGFPEHRIDAGQAPIIGKIDRFKTLGEEVIEEYFEKKDMKNQ